MRRLTGGIAAMLAVCLLAACAIEPGPVEIKDRPTNGLGAKPATKPDLARKQPIDDAGVLVDRFLKASADDVATREATLRSYLLKSEPWTPGSVINVIHEVEALDPVESPDGIKVRKRVQYVGLLNVALGTIEPSTKGEEVIEFTVVKVPDEGFLLRAPRAELLLSEAGFLEYYESRPIYFWDATGSQLVPDLRYLARYLPEAEKATRLVDWLYQGPVVWLDATVRKLPLATKPADRVTVTDDRSVVVTFNTQISAEELRPIGQQLLKTLVPQPLLRLQLKTQGQLVSSLVPDFVEQRSPNRYAIVKGVVCRLRAPTGPENLAPLRLPDAANKGVAEVAFAHGESSAMIVHDGGGAQRLSVVLLGSQVAPVSLPGLSSPRSIAQPVWLSGDANVGLVLADEALFQVFSDGRASRVAQVDRLTAMSVSPDGRRIAMVIGGQLVLRALLFTDKAISLGQWQTTVPTQLSEVHSVAFGGPLELVVAGRDAKGVRILTTNLDGIRQLVSRGNSLTTNVFHLVADPGSGNALYEATGLGASQYQFSGSESLEKKVLCQGATSPQALLPTDVHAPSFEG